ncbi:MAG: GtrA family protein [Chitinophagaceae bacterium]|jgi:putative flippase GtrA|nr:GtrA family protein [Chitinophagaceae bacterium]
MNELIDKAFRFGVTGCIGLVIDFGITFLLKEKIKWNKYIANGCGFIVAATGNFFINRNWTFSNHNPHVATQYFSFVAVSVAGLLFNTLILHFLTDKKKKHFYLSKLITIAIVFIWNFSANTLLTFRHG